jgi:geranylgeranyl diphosphate/geranylgeranyl-bacteriochlorophyllide a reductase
MYDIAIIGAGPAGATLARLVGSRYRVLLIDKGRSDEPPSCEADADRGPPAGKCCGGLLAPDAQRMISRFGLGLPRSVLVEPQLFVVRAIDVPRRLERYYQRYYINMDRAAFDRWLVSLVPPGVERRFGCRYAGCERDGEGFRVRLVERGVETVERARVLVGADGARSRVRAALATLDSRLRGNDACAPSRAGGAPEPPAYAAIQEWVEAEPGQPCFSAVFDPEITDYYGWTIPKGDWLLIGAALRPRRQTAERFERFKGKLKTLGFRFGRTVRREGAVILRPRRLGDLSTGGRGVALVGEAGGWISPSSAEGYSYAFRGALALAEALAPGLEGFERRYARRMRPLRRNLLLKCLKAGLIFNPTLRSLAMRSGLQSLEVYRG